MPTELQFDRAVYDGDVPHVLKCAWCSRGLAHEDAFEANGKLICPNCAGRALAAKPDDSKRILWKAIAWGALVSAALAFAFAVLGRLELSAGHFWVVYILTFPIGLLIGKAMREATRGAGGRKFQVAAALLAYAAVTAGLSGAWQGGDGAPWFVYPFLPILPLLQLFVSDARQMALWELFLASIAMRWAWSQLPAWPLKIVPPADRTAR